MSAMKRSVKKGLPIQLKTVSADFFTYPTSEDDLVYTVQLKTILFTVQVKTILLYPTSEDDYITILIGTKKVC